MKSFAIVSLLTTTVLAASSASGTSSSSQSPLIPSGISSGCQTYLINLNTDSDVAACTSPIVSATSSFGDATSTQSSATISSALQNLCASSVSTACSKSMLSGKLANFAQACSAELVETPVAGVRMLYDAVYILVPFLDAVCSKDDSGRYCVSNNATSQATGSSNLQKYLSSPVSSSAVSPNATTFAASNVAFLLLQPDLSDAALCTSCTRDIISSYINFQTAVPYACGVPQSTLFGGQTALYSAVQSKCGQDFLGGAVEAAGGLANGLLSGGPRSVGGDFKGTIAVMLSVVGLGFVAVL